MRFAIVLTFESAHDHPRVAGSQIGDVLLAIDPPNLPIPANEARVVVDDLVPQLLEWLDEEGPRTTSTDEEES